MSQPRHLDESLRAHLRLGTPAEYLGIRSGVHRVSRARALTKGPEVRVPALTDDLNDELQALLAADSQARHPAGRRRYVDQ
jgi:hypothetical protein